MWSNFATTKKNEEDENLQKQCLSLKGDTQ